MVGVTGRSFYHFLRIFKRWYFLTIVQFLFVSLFAFKISLSFLRFYSQWLRPHPATTPPAPKLCSQVSNTCLWGSFLSLPSSLLCCTLSRDIRRCHLMSLRSSLSCPSSNICCAHNLEYSLCFFLFSYGVPGLCWMDRIMLTTAFHCVGIVAMFFLWIISTHTAVSPLSLDTISFLFVRKSVLRKESDLPRSFDQSWKSNAVASDITPCALSCCLSLSHPIAMETRPWAGDFWALGSGSTSFSTRFCFHPACWQCHPAHNFLVL